MRPSLWPFLGLALTRLGAVDGLVIGLSVTFRDFGGGDNMVGPLTVFYRYRFQVRPDETFRDLLLRHIEPSFLRISPIRRSLLAQ